MLIVSLEKQVLLEQVSRLHKISYPQFLFLGLVKSDNTKRIWLNWTHFIQAQADTTRWALTFSNMQAESGKQTLQIQQAGNQQQGSSRYEWLRRYSSNNTWQMCVGETVFYIYWGTNEQMNSRCAGRWLIPRAVRRSMEEGKTLDGVWWSGEALCQPLSYTGLHGKMVFVA